MKGFQARARSSAVLSAVAFRRRQGFGGQVAKAGTSARIRRLPSRPLLWIFAILCRYPSHIGLWVVEQLYGIR